MIAQDLNVPQGTRLGALPCHLAGRPFLTILEDSQSLARHPFCEITTVIYFFRFRTADTAAANPSEALSLFIVQCQQQMSFSACISRRLQEGSSRRFSGCPITASMI